MASEQLSLNKNEVNAIEREVSKVTVGTGRVVLIVDGEPVDSAVDGGNFYDVDNKPVTILALEGSNYLVGYAEPTGVEPPVLPREIPAGLVPPPSNISNHGDTGGNTGSYESRTVKELQDLARERGVSYSGLDKAELIEALRK